MYGRVLRIGVWREQTAAVCVVLGREGKRSTHKTQAQGHGAGAVQSTLTNNCEAILPTLLAAPRGLGQLRGVSGQHYFLAVLTAFVTLN